MEITSIQKKIIETNNRSLLISASAGSGKTFVVIEKIVDSLINKGLDVKELLVVTFTNHAAAELKERLTKKLYKSLEEDYPKNIKEHILKQIKEIPSCNISTIHSFCLNVIRDNFVYLEIDPLIQICDSSKAQIMLFESINEVIDNRYVEEDEDFLSLIDYIGSEENLINTLYKIYLSYVNISFRDQWIEDISSIYNPIDKKLNKKIEELQRKVISNIFEKININVSALEIFKKELEQKEEFRTRVELLDELLQSLYIVLKSKTLDDLNNNLNKAKEIKGLPKTKVSDKELAENVKKIKKIVLSEIDKLLSIAYANKKEIIKDLNSAYNMIALIQKMLKETDEIFLKKKKEENCLDFSDFEHLALKALENKEIAEGLKNKYKQIYIDEYQDTSLIQEEIIKKISKDDNVFLVGDVKQSIYGFRNARPDLFMDKYMKYIDIEEDEKNAPTPAKVILSTNFRSRKEVLDGVNFVFSQIMGLHLGGCEYNQKEELIYGNLYPKELNKFNYKTEINLIKLSKDDVDEKENEEEIEEESVEKIFEEEGASPDLEGRFSFNSKKEEKSGIYKEAIYIAEHINKLIKDKFEVYDKDLNINRPCSYRDIVILLRNTKVKASLVEEALKLQNIPVYFEGSEGFYKTDEINLIINILKIIDNPYNDIALASVMYSIVGSFTLDELTLIRMDTKGEYLLDSIKKYIETKSLDILSLKLQSFLEKVNKYRSYLNIYSLAEIIVKIYEDTNIYSLLLLEKNGNLKCANLDAFLEIVLSYEKNEKKPLMLLLKYLDKISNKGASKESPKILADNEDIVRIMTIHKSKGLEFPIVIIAGVSNKYNKNSSKDKILLDKSFGIGLSAVDNKYFVTYPTIIKKMIEDSISQNEISEEIRLLYTAMTRARDKLIIYGIVTKDLEELKEKYIILKDQMKIPPLFVKEQNSYLNLLLLACLYKPDENIIDFNIYSNLPDDKTLKEEINKKQENTLDREKNNIEILIEVSKNENIQVDNIYLKKLEEIYSRKYKYEKTLNISQKYTVTELVKEKQDDVLQSMVDLRPECITDTISDASYGTFIHKIIERLDLKNAQETDILRLIESELLDKEKNLNVNTYKVVKNIQKMLGSKIQEFVEGAKNIYKEYEFVALDDLEGILEEKLEEKTLIQGVIDMYIITKDNIHVIIDFKTDALDEKSLIEKYNKQLKLYERAIEIITKSQVSKYIYSFHLEKLIEIK